ncbi:MAG: XTP/dITP diphosphatase [Candidatus Tectomicrobia bacterium]|uniref:dITP/XTP pyrophosphatase n=1 Tax=Tectimicrobiota bacterium TaxID=2528274 RepID=A0A932CQV3_UNCTE|nr:XTP/dITP diphosphatase [Candidatus Tectomicrobia bacterium]
MVNAREIVLATRNAGKVREIEAGLKGLGLRVLSLGDFPEVGELPEEGESYEENAYGKARIVAEATGRIALADDSGLEVEALGGKPGVRSARFGGEGASSERKNRRLLDLLRDLPWERRKAQFVCVLVIVLPYGEAHVCRGVCPGRITTELRGQQGFGYDPIFFLPEYGKTMAELDLSLKNQVSHRGQALRQAREVLARLFPA